jgi:hypothetical protein
MQNQKDLMQGGGEMVKRIKPNPVRILEQLHTANVGNVLDGAILPGIAQLLILVQTPKERAKEKDYRAHPNRKDPKALANQATK